MKYLKPNKISECVYLVKPTYLLSINEQIDKTYVPRFTLKNPDIFSDFPSNTPTKFSVELIEKAISYGMIIQIDYKGEKDENLQGHDRSIYPMVIGKSKKGKLLLRGYHLKGWSVSNGGSVDKQWRLFRCDRILNMSFTGACFRIAPEGYNAQDKGIADIIKAADPEEIQKNQQQLLDQKSIDSLDRVVLKKINSIEVKDIKYNLQLVDPWKDNVIPKKDAANIRITFAKPLVGKGQWIAIIGTSIEPNNTFNLISDDSSLGTYKSVKWIMADQLNQEPIEQQVEFKTFLFLSGK